MRRVPAGVWVLSVGPEGARGNITVSSLVPVSMEPPSVLVSINHSAEVYPLLEKADVFAANLLAPDQHEVAAHCAEHFEGEARFARGNWMENQGQSWLAGARAWLLCRTVQRMAFATHEIFIAEVESVALGDGQASALTYADGAYGSFSPF